MEGNAAQAWEAGQLAGKVLVCRDSRSLEQHRRSDGYGRAPRWRQVHETLVELSQQEALSDYEQGRWLLEALREGVHAKLGFGSHLEYGDRLFGYGPRGVAERLRVATALEGLPQTREALVAGELHWSAVRELCRVVTAETEGDWVEAARGGTARQKYGAAILPPAGEGPPSRRELGGAMETAYGALCRLGFRKTDVRRALRELESPPADVHVGSGDGSEVEGIIRQALAVLTG